MNIEKFVLFGLLIAVISYLLGSLSFSIILTKAYKKDDIRKYGSGNAGATNVLRSVGKSAAALTFLLDFLKCAISVIIGLLIFQNICQAEGVNLAYANFGKYIAGFCCILGHIFPVYYGFRGGKGVVTASAMIAFVDWRVFIFVIAMFIISFAIKKTVSLSSILAAAVYPVATFFVTYIADYQADLADSKGQVNLVYLVAVTVISATVAGIVIVKHRANIGRIIAGTEKPIFSKK